MRMTKKMTAFLLAFLVVLSPVTALPFATDGFAAEDPVLEIRTDKTKVAPGDTFTVTLSLDRTVNSRGFGLEYEYDPNAFEFVSGSWSDTVGSSAILKSAHASDAVFAAETAVEISGAVFSFTLKATDFGSCNDSFEIRASTNHLLPAASANTTVAIDHLYDHPGDAACNRCEFVRALPTYVHAVHRGDTVAVSVSLSREKSVRGFGLDFLNAYDHDAFEWVDGDWSASIKAGALLAATNPGGEAVFASAEPVSVSGEIYSFELKVKDDAAFDDYEVSVGISGIADAEISTTVITVHECVASDEIEYDENVHWNVCKTYACERHVNEASHEYTDESDSDCNGCGKVKYLLGDVNGDEKVDLDDAIYLLYHVNFQSIYPVNQPVDFDGSGNADLDDAIYLLYHVNFSSLYPLHHSAS